jgi:hypothetical protein
MLPGVLRETLLMKDRHAKHLTPEGPGRMLFCGAGEATIAWRRAAGRCANSRGARRS